jgi:hypothetical protein
MPKVKRDQLYRILASLNGHFSPADISPADADQWRELKRLILRMKDGLGLARLELESGSVTAETARKALKHVHFGLGLADEKD